MTTEIYPKLSILSTQFLSVQVPKMFARAPQHKSECNGGEVEVKETAALTS